MRSRRRGAAAVAVLAAAILLGGGSPLGAQAPCERQVVDALDQPDLSQMSVNGNSPDDSEVDSGLTTAVGGERDATLTQTQSNAQLPPIGSGVTIVAGELFWSHGVDTASVLTLTWDGPDGDTSSLDPTGLGGVDYSGEGPSGEFRFEITSYDRPATNTPFTLEVHTDAGNASTQTVTPVAPTAGTVVAFPLAAFTPLAGSGADFADVGAIVLRAGAPDFVSLDMVFAAISGPCASEVLPLKPPVDPPVDPPDGPDTPAVVPTSSEPVAGTPTSTG